ncbi:UNVERIFIED_CONTAM: Polycomb group protein EMBRYONIC FLOWER 2 [Sesamum radiatum]|uniref:Polycomb group protein EMBRYONIC FLOWER 2 n=1 Tax=Sesamum radiatum TaxID=300843 RepID=A0AAW2NFF0_SESRA
MCRQDPRAHLSAEEQIAAEESLSIYCKPVELYNILQRRAVRNADSSAAILPSEMSTIQNTSKTQEKDSAVYRYSRECILMKCTGDDRMNQDQANFILPEINKLSAEVKSGSLSILFVSCAELFKEHVGGSLFPANVGGHCFLGKIPMELLHLSWEKSLNLSSGERAEMLSTVDLHSCFLKTSCFGEDKCFSFHSPHAGSTAMSQQLQVRIAAEEIGVRERSLYDSFAYSDIPSSTLPQIIRLRTGNVVFNYKYYNNKLQRTEGNLATSFLSVKTLLLPKFKEGPLPFPIRIRLFHSLLLASLEWDWLDEDKGALYGNGLCMSFCYAFPFLSKYILKVQVPSGKIVEKKLDFASLYTVTEDFTCPFCLVKCASFKGLRYHLPSSHDLFNFEFWVWQRVGTVMHPVPEFHLPQLIHMQTLNVFSHYLVATSHLRHYYSLRRQESYQLNALTPEIVLSCRNGSSFTHIELKVLADGHIPWACEAFSKLHGQDLVRTPALLWCWRLFMIKLWNHGLLDARTMNNCNIILEQFQGQDADP